MKMEVGRALMAGALCLLICAQITLAAPAAGGEESSPQVRKGRGTYESIIIPSMREQGYTGPLSPAMDEAYTEETVLCPLHGPCHVSTTIFTG